MITRTRSGLVWYASYGSNLAYQQRFLCYINGGTPVGSHRSNPGCRNSTPPLEKKPIILNYELFFAGYFEGWSGAAAFIRRGGANRESLGRMYLITEEQFNDIVIQENDRKVDGTNLLPPVESFACEPGIVLPGLAPYSRLVVVGVEASYPIVTFTAPEGAAPPIGPPSEPYVKIIAAGIKETYPLKQDREIVEYLAEAEGIKGQVERDQLAKWVAEAQDILVPALTRSR
jgi:hypothetical protein